MNISIDSGFAMNKKGLSLPINLIVILAIAILVMVVIAAMFVMYTGQAGSSLSDSTAWSQGCQTVRQRGCLSTDFTGTTAYKVPNYRPSGGTTDESILVACQRFFADTTLDGTTCRTKCCG